MRRERWTVCVLLVLALAGAGCGRARRTTFGAKEVKADSATVEAPTDRPAAATYEWGSPKAKVRVIAFFFVSKQKSWPAVMQTLQALVKKYPNQLYVKYVDLRTPEGSALRESTSGGGGGPGFLIDGQSSYTVSTPPPPHTVNFDQDPGRYWTLDDLKTVVAQEVAKAYGK